MNIGDRIKKTRKSIGFTQKQLAEKVNVSSQVISNWERSYTTPDYDDVTRLANVLDVSTEYLHGRTNKPDTDKTDNEKDPISTAFHDYDNITEEEKEYLELQLEIFRRLKKDREK